MRPFRSILFIPGNRQRMLDKGPTTGADALLLDLEDAVPLDDKANARTMVRDFLPTVGDPPVLVRVNPVGSGLTRDDLEAVVVPGLYGIFLAKVESPDDVRQVSAWLDALEGPAGIESGSLPVVCMLESANSVRLAYEIARASPRVGSLCYSGGENGDLQTDLRCDWSIEGTEMLYARSKIVLDARAAGIDYPLEGVFVDIDNVAGLIADTTLSKRLGYKGRTVIHPKHVATVNEIYTPGPEEIDYFRGLLAAFEAALGEGRGSVTYQGKLIDYAMAARARSVLALLEAQKASGGSP
jgi:citrate lyase subunit beta/citryl-CoA lyase